MTTPKDGYEIMPGSTEQVEVFLDLQRMLIKLYNMWPEDTAIAVYAAAGGSVVALIEAQYKVHVEECPNCQEEGRPSTIDLAGTAKSNFDYYYVRGKEQSDLDKAQASEMVHKFFKKDTQ
jgi:hypothetical protein